MSSVRRLASGLYRRFRRHALPPSGGPVKRPVVCLYASNCLQYPMVFHATLCAGATITTADPHLSAGNFRFRLHFRCCCSGRVICCCCVCVCFLSMWVGVFNVRLPIPFFPCLFVGVRNRRDGRMSKASVSPFARYMNLNLSVY